MSLELQKRGFQTTTKRMNAVKSFRSARVKVIGVFVGGGVGAL